MQTLIINNRNFSLPSQWNELTKRQVRLLTALTVSNQTQGNLKKLFFLMLINQLPMKDKLYLLYFFCFPASQTERADMLYTASAFRADIPFTQQKFKKLRVKNVLLFGPADSLSNCSFYEFIEAENQFFLLNKTKDPKHLDLLLATLYRPAKTTQGKWSDDCRVQLSEKSRKFSLKAIQQADKTTKQAILLWFDGCRIEISQAFPKIFTRKQDNFPPTNPAPEWTQVMIELAESIDRIESIGRTNLWTALAKINNTLSKPAKK